MNFLLETSSIERYKCFVEVLHVGSHGIAHYVVQNVAEI